MNINLYTNSNIRFLIVANGSLTIKEEKPIRKSKDEIIMIIVDLVFHETYNRSFLFSVRIHSINTFLSVY